MPEIPNKTAKGIQISKIAKEVNRSSTEVVDYLKRIGVEVSGIMSKVDEPVYHKVLGHFKSDMEEAEKHKQKLLEFKKKHSTVEIHEIDDVLQKESERQKTEEDEMRKKVEIELKLKREREEQAKKDIDEKRKQFEQKKTEVEKAAIETEEKIKPKKKSKEEDKKETIPVITAEKKPSKKDKTEKVTDVKDKKDVKVEKDIKDGKDEKKHVKEQPVFETTLDKLRKATIKKVGNIELSELAKRTQPRETWPEKRRKKKEVAKEKDKRVFKFERVTITDDYKKPKPQRHKSPFHKPSYQDKQRPKKDEKEKPKVKDTLPLSPDAEQKKRDAEKKNKSKKQKYSDGADLKRRKKFDEEELTAEIEDAIRETMAKIDETGTATSRALLRKKKKKERIEEEQKQQEEILARQNILQVTEYLSASELASLMEIDVSEVIQKCFALGMMITINQRLDRELIILLADEFGFQIEFQKEYEVDLLADKIDALETLLPRPPVVTIMGHVDHGKTSLLDYIRKANVVAGEAGGITQHIGAYQVKLENGKLISFLDTPGHEAFTAMRARGAQLTDIVVLVVAADDSVMPQTVEAINHALAANVPIVIAINKIDKPNANVNNIKTQLSERGLLVEEWGGKYQHAEIAAKSGLNVEKLLEKILLEAELLDLKTNPSRNARGAVVEAQLDKGKGTVATVLVQKGTLNIGDSFVAGIYSGRVKAMYDERGHKIKVAKPATPVQVLGFDGMPQAGDKFVVLDNERDAKEIALKRQLLKREQDFRQIRFTTLDDISKQIKEGKQVDLNVIIKGDVDGSVEALSDSLLKLGSNEVRVSVIHKGIGEISENDVLLAAASKAIIIGFNVRPNLKARKTAEAENVDIRLHNIIYDVINEMKLALEGLLEPDKKEEVLATVEVRETFKIPKIGLIAGCYVTDGKVTRNNKVRLLRDGFVVFDGSIFALKRFKEDVREVESGYECGLSLENFNDIKVGDIIEAYHIVEIKRKLV